MIRLQYGLAVRALRISSPLLELCTAALSRVASFERPADAVLSEFFKNHREAGQGDRALVAETVFSALRRWRWLQWAAGDGDVRRKVAVTWTLLMDLDALKVESLLSTEEVAWLGAIRERIGMEAPFEVRCNLPDWVIELLRNQMSDAKLLELASSLMVPAPLDLRVNLLKTTREEAIGVLSADGLTASPTPYSPAGIRVPGRPSINRLPVFLDGRVEVQDEGSQLLAWLMEPRRGEMVVDYCAGAGGKTLALGMLMRSTGRLYAFDVSARRLEKFKPRLARSGLSNVHPQRIERGKDMRVRRLSGKIDRVLVDAPCSGMGTLRRNPDLRWRQSGAMLDELLAKQSSILDEAARLVKPGGRLVYATCSILDAENSGVVTGFLSRHTEFKLRPARDILTRQGIPVECGEFLELTPARHETDGFFAAVLERAA